jgi:hypothetical protein
MTEETKDRIRCTALLVGLLFVGVVWPVGSTLYHIHKYSAICDKMHGITTITTTGGVKCRVGDKIGGYSDFTWGH